VVKIAADLGAITVGNFSLMFDGQETGCLAFDSSEEAVEAALNSLTTIGAGGVAVTRAGNGTAFTSFGFDWRVTFVAAALAARGNLPQMLALEGGAANGSCADFAPANSAASVSVETDADGGAIVAGSPYIVRVHAVNSVGSGPDTQAASLDLYSFGDSSIALARSLRAIIPRSVPSAP